MIPTSAVRETLILILFGIILVPIAAKRAQDARGYWQTFQLQDMAAATASSTSSSSPPSHDQALVLAPSIIHNHHNNDNNHVIIAMAQNESAPAVVPAAVYVTTSSAPRAETRTGLTICFGHATTAVGGEAMATTAPRLPQHKQQQQQAVSPSKTDGPHPAAAKMSDASSKGRWTLIWMGSAIAAVAILMSLC